MLGTYESLDAFDGITIIHREIFCHLFAGVVDCIAFKMYTLRPPFRPMREVTDHLN